jgi:hypothetical protein
MLDPDNLVKRHLKPVLAKAGIKQGGMHAFRHSNATIMDQNNVPLKIRQDRLGFREGHSQAVNVQENQVRPLAEQAIRYTSTKPRILRVTHSRKPLPSSKETVDSKSHFYGTPSLPGR